MSPELALVPVAVVTAANMVWCAAVWWRLRRLRDEGAVLSEAARRLDEAVERARAALEGLRAELVASERAVELRSREARARAAELARLLEAARRTRDPAARPRQSGCGPEGTRADGGTAQDDPVGAVPAATAGAKTEVQAVVAAPSDVGDHARGRTDGTVRATARAPSADAVAPGPGGAAELAGSDRPAARHGESRRASAAAEDILRALAGMR